MTKIEFLIKNPFIKNMETCKEFVKYNYFDHIKNQPPKMFTLTLCYEKSLLISSSTYT